MRYLLDERVEARIAGFSPRMAMTPPASAATIRPIPPMRRFSPSPTASSTQQVVAFVMPNERLPASP